MSLTGVKISEEVWITCLTHALSTETEEVMGLLLGDIKEDKRNGVVTAFIWGAVPQARSDRRKDRVETTPEQLAAATAEAERMSNSIGNRTRVIGWYHSHPHITVLPSHVDVRTQGTYQLLDPGFVGVIFSCFNEDANKVGRIQAIAFQSIDGRSRTISKAPATDGSRQFASAQQAGGFGYDSSARSSGSFVSSMTLQNQLDQPTSSSVKIGGGLEELLGEYQPSPAANQRNPEPASSTLDENEMVHLSPGMQEAMHLSTLDMSAGEFSRKEIPLQVVPAREFGLVNVPADPLHAMQHTLYEEERAAYRQAMSQGKQGQHIHPLAALHHSATYQASLCRLLEFCLCPTMSSLWDRLQQNTAKLSLLQEEAASLQLLSMSRQSLSPTQSPMRRAPSASPRSLNSARKFT